MTRKTSSITVTQRFDADEAAPGGKPVYRYVVTATKNTILHHIGEVLSAKRVEELIRLGVDVSVK